MTIAAPVEHEELRAADLSAVQHQLTVARIMTPRSEFLCCVSDEPAQAAFARVPEIYDALPVIEGCDHTDSSARVVGLMHRNRVPFRNSTISVGDLMDTQAPAAAHLPSRLLISYMQGLAGSPVELVAEDGNVVGLVTTVDLQRLPVRTALFALIIDIEQSIGDLIELVLPDSEIWDSVISKDLRGALHQGLKRATGNDGIGRAVLGVDFSVKLDLLRACFREFDHLAWINREAKEIRDLRNQVAHGAPFPDLNALPDQVRRLFQLRRLVVERVQKARG